MSMRFVNDDGMIRFRFRLPQEALDDFAVARDIVQANELGSDLKNFSTAPSMFLLVTEDGCSI